MAAKRPSIDQVSTRPLLDKLGVRPGSRVAIVNLEEPGFVKQVKERTKDVVAGKPREKVDLVFLGAQNVGDLRRLDGSRAGSSPMVQSGLCASRAAEARCEILTSSTPGSRPGWSTTRSRAF